MYVLKQQELIPIELRSMLAAELSYPLNLSRTDDPRAIAAMALLIVTVQKCNVSPFELRCLEVDMGNRGMMDRFILTASLIGFDFVGDRAESLPHQNFPNPRFEYLHAIRETYNSEAFIELIKVARPHGISSSHDMIGLVRDLITDNLVPLP